MEYCFNHIVASGINEKEYVSALSLEKAKRRKLSLQEESLGEKTTSQYHFGGRSRRILMVCFGSVMSNQRP